MNDHLLTSEQVELKKMIRDFAVKEIIPAAKELDRTGEYPHELYKKAVAMGLHTFAAPAEYGGAGFDTETCAILNEELAWGDAGFCLTLGTSNLAAAVVNIGGTEAQRKRYYDIIVPGGRAAFCLTEAGAGSNAAACRTTAEKVGDEYIINGAKCFITNGGVADIYTVMAMTDKSKGTRGMSAFIVERNREGVSVGKEEDKMGIRLSNTTEVIFRDVRIPASNLIGLEGQGYKLAMSTLDRTRASGAAAAIGIAQRAIDLSLEYAKERVTFGEPISHHQGIQFMLADMEIQTQAARELVRKACRLIDHGIVDGKISAVAKTHAGDTAVRVATDAIQIYGGYGYSREYPVEKLLRDAKIYQIFEGTNQIQRMVIAGHMLKG